jgi:hypothetical protein
MPSRTYTFEKIKSAPAFKASKYRVILLYGEEGCKWRQEVPTEACVPK